MCRHTYVGADDSKLLMLENKCNCDAKVQKGHKPLEMAGYTMTNWSSLHRAGRRQSNVDELDESSHLAECAASIELIHGFSARKTEHTSCARIVVRGEQLGCTLASNAH